MTILRSKSKTVQWTHNWIACFPRAGRPIALDNGDIHHELIGSSLSYAHTLGES